MEAVGFKARGGPEGMGRRAATDTIKGGEGWGKRRQTETWTRIRSRAGEERGRELVGSIRHYKVMVIYHIRGWVGEG